MALFSETGRDAKLSVLTQVGALDEDDEAEVVAFLQKLNRERVEREQSARIKAISQAVKNNPETLPEKDTPLSDDERRIIRETARTASEGFISPHVHMADYMALIRTVKRILKKQAEKTLKTDDTDINRFNHWVLSPPDSFRSVARITSRKGVRLQEGEHIYAASAKSIIDDLVDFMLEPSGISDARFCTVCGNVFVANIAKAQELCSHRCAARRSWQKHKSQKT